MGNELTQETFYRIEQEPSREGGVYESCTQEWKECDKDVAECTEDWELCNEFQDKLQQEFPDYHEDKFTDSC